MVFWNKYNWKKYMDCFCYFTKWIVLFWWIIFFNQTYDFFYLQMLHGIKSYNECSNDFQILYDSDIFFKKSSKVKYSWTFYSYSLIFYPKYSSLTIVLCSGVFFFLKQNLALILIQVSGKAFSSNFFNFRIYYAHTFVTDSVL